MKMKKSLFLLTGIIGFNLQVDAQIGNFSDPVRLGSGVNTEAEETMPVFSKDSTILYFSRIFDPTHKDKEAKFNDQEIWFSLRENGEYTTAKPLTELNNKYNNAVVGLSKDGTSMYVLDSYEGKKDLVKGCAVSKQKGKAWEKPVHIDVPTLDINGDFYGFHIDESETVMIISYEGPNTMGGEDLYVSTNSGGVWSAPIHMGSVINTPSYEISPFLSNSLDTLFFASNGLGGEGDVDIFYSIRQNGSWTDWSTPVNLGPKINSPKYDAFFSYSANKVYWASNREGERADIYYANILPPPPPPPLNVTAATKDVTVYKGTDGSIDITIEGGVGPYTVTWSNGATTEDIDHLPKGTYTVIVTDATGQTAEVIVEMKEPAAPVIDLNALLKDVKPIYFDLGKYNIRKDASKELDKVVKIMNDNPTLEIELQSHTDCQASYEYNMILSDNRAKASAAYIKERITNPERISGKGYGESQLKVDCPCEGDVKSKCTDKEHQLNRRTEFILRPEGSSKDGDVTGHPIVMTTPVKGSKGNKGSKTGTSSSTPSESGTSSSSSSSSSSSTTGAPSKFRSDIPLTDENKANIANGFYIVNEGETLYRVSVNSKVSLVELRRINNLTSNSIKPGTKLLLK